MSTYNIIIIIILYYYSLLMTFNFRRKYCSVARGRLRSTTPESKFAMVCALLYVAHGIWFSLVVS